MVGRSNFLLATLCTSGLLFLSACGSSPTARFYTLTPQGGEPSSYAAPLSDHRGIIAVGPVEIADYLDRPQIVRRSGPAVLSPLEFDRWAGSLRDNVGRVLVDNLTLLLAPEGLAVFPWEETGRYDRRLGISVNRFEAMENGSVLFQVHWALWGREGGELLQSGNTVLVEPMPDRGVEAQVEAMSSALAEFSRRIAGEVAMPRQQEGSSPGGMPGGG